MKPRVDYHSYLHLDKLLDCQHPESLKAGRPAHDEMLFISVHQSYEIWFKQMIYELDSVISLLSHQPVFDEDMGVVVGRLRRLTAIVKVLIQQVDVLETMTPLDFLDFRDLLFPASGFQSLQFRLYENKLGLPPKQRLSYNEATYSAHFPDEQKKQIADSESSPNLFSCVESWLARTPFLQGEGYDFWKSYQAAASGMFARERALIDANISLSSTDKDRNLNIVKNSETTFNALFDEAEYEKLRGEGRWRLSYKAVHAALLIQLYRHQPVFQLPFAVLTSLLDIDETMTQWRSRHALLARRMLGTKVGTGGSSGSKYLQQSTEQHKIFSDFFQLTTFFIPRSELPELPPQLQNKMKFNYQMENQ